MTTEAPEELERDALDAVEDDDGEAYPPPFVRHRGAPFTGVVIDREDPVTRLPYLDGRPHGIARTIDPSGRLRWEAHYVAGRRVGEHRAWAPDGTLVRRDMYDETGHRLASEVFDLAGRRRWDSTPQRTRTWYADGQLRTDRAGGERRVYLRDGRRACIESSQAARFDDAAMHDGLLELLADLELELLVWQWLHRRLDAGDPAATGDLRRALGHPELGVRASALLLIGHRRVRALADDVRPLLADPRVPPLRLGEYPGQGGRGFARSLAALARDALDRLAD